jgi:alkyl hydroperoxide reductase subunit AhpC
MSTNLRLGSVVSNFTAETTQGTIQFHDFIGDSWTILFSHPDDFTPVCTTELGRASKLAPEFEKRGVKLIGLSANDIDSHDRWIKDIDQYSGTTLKFPIIGDKDRKIATEFGMLDYQDATNVDAKGLPLTVRTVFIIDPKKTIRTMIAYPASVGRNFNELIRVIDSLQGGDKYKFTTPVDWVPGQDVVIPPFIKGEERAKLFPGEHKEIFPYLTTTADPSTKA